MNIIKPSCTLLKVSDRLGHIEKCGRICYKSEDKITPNSSLKFVGSLLRNKHHAMLEHGVYHFIASRDLGNAIGIRGHGTFFTVDMLSSIHVQGIPPESCIVTCNVRALWDYVHSPDAPVWVVESLLSAIRSEYPVEYELLYASDDLECDHLSFAYCVPEEWVHHSEIPDIVKKRHLHVTLHFVCDRGVSHEFVRHRPCSFAQESTRYCNYSKSKFGDAITVIEPLFWSYIPNDLERNSKHDIWVEAMQKCEDRYFELLDYGATPQEARSVLPNSLKTELVITATISEWEHIISLRCASDAHPQMREVMQLGVEELLKYDKQLPMIK